MSPLRSEYLLFVLVPPLNASGNVLTIHRTGELVVAQMIFVEHALAELLPLDLPQRPDGREKSTITAATEHDAEPAWLVGRRFALSQTLGPLDHLFYGCQQHRFRCRILQ